MAHDPKDCDGTIHNGLWAAVVFAAFLTLCAYQNDQAPAAEPLAPTSDAAT